MLDKVAKTKDSLAMHIILHANPILNAYQGSDLFGKAIFLILFLLSIATWVIFIQKFTILRTIRKASFQKNFTQTAHPFGQLYSTLQKNRGSPPDYLKACLQQTVSQEVAKMEKRISFLSTVVSLAPFLGLLGTVWGILLTFSELQLGKSANASSVVMGGLAMALGTTVLGLVVAIPALIAYNYLRTAIRHFSQEMNDFSNLLISSDERIR